MSGGLTHRPKPLALDRLRVNGPFDAGCARGSTLLEDAKLCFFNKPCSLHLNRVPDEQIFGFH